MSTHYFELYGLAVSFYPDQDEVRKRYLQISRENHPDLSGSDLDEQASSSQISSENNKAYKILKDRNLRIRYVLGLLGFNIDESDKLPADFLIDMMEWNERVEEGKSASKEEQQSIEIEFNGLNEDLDASLEQLSKEFDENGKESILPMLKEICLKQKYLLRLKESIDTFA
jgi:molecular chaperone HscB